MWEGSFRDAGFDAGTMEQPPGPLGVRGSNRFVRQSTDEFYHFVDAQTGPWFAWIAPSLPHTPHDPPDDLKQLYEWRGLATSAVDYFANLTRMDRAFGEILAFLDQRGIGGDTVVIYLADNGWIQRLDRPTPYWNAIGEDHGKLSAHDRGFRTPVVIRWPREIKAAQRRTHLINFGDIFETILDYGQASSHDCSSGHSVRQVAADANAAWGRNRIFGRTSRTRLPTREVAASHSDRDRSNDLPRATADIGLYLRQGSRWGFTYVPARGTEELYDLHRDPLGTTNVAQRHPQRVHKMRTRLVKWNARLIGKTCPVAPC